MWSTNQNSVFKTHRDLPKYTQIGNAVPVKLAYEIGNHLKDLIKQFVNIDFELATGERKSYFSVVNWNNTVGVQVPPPTPKNPLSCKRYDKTPSRE